MELLVIGIDALDQNMVQSLNLKNLLQSESGPVIVPLEPTEKKPLSAQVWASFMTGKHLNVSFERRTLVPFGSSLIKSVRFLKKLLHPGLGIESALNQKLGTYMAFPRLKYKTFVETAGVDYCCSPFHDYMNNNPEIFKKATLFMNNHLNYEDYRKILLNNFDKNIGLISQKLKNSDSRVFFCYFHILDHIQHFFFRDTDFVESQYKKMDEVVRMLKNLSNPKATLIIADHGMQTGIHTIKGFYSCNKELSLKSPKITEFYNIILRHAGVPTSDEQEYVKKHLRSLGYI